MKQSAGSVVEFSADLTPTGRPSARDGWTSAASATAAVTAAVTAVGADGHLYHPFVPRRVTDWLRDRIHSLARTAGRTVERTRREYREGSQASGLDLPRDEDGRARIVCRRHAERRAVELDAEGRPDCFDADHPDCRGCAEDVAGERVETW